MKIVLIPLFAFAILLSNGCVTRTYVDNPNHEGGKVKSEKRIWIWQSEFRNPTH